ncbi:MAG: ATP-binding protein [Clostridiales bacterium]|nr:ATP-binding protein [Clostridiales bacterium]
MIGSKRIKAIVGHYGSGKTEIAMNLAIELAKTQKVTLVDLDIVNPYFRSAEHAEKLKECGVKLVKPEFAATGVDVPSLSAHIDAAILDESSTVILDVGGDDEGARALGRFKPYFDRFGLDLFAVVNPYRPRSENEERIIEMMEAIQIRARFPVTGFINNANVAHLTETENLLYGREMLRKVSEQTGIPVVMECGLKEVKPAEMPEGIAFLELIRYTKPEWMD